MSFTVNQCVEADGGATSQAVSATIPIGHSIGVLGYFDTFGNGGSLSAPTDSSGANTYSVGTAGNDGGTHGMATFWSLAISHAVTSVTQNTTGTSGAGGFVRLAAYDITATGTIQQIDSKVHNTNPSTTGTDAISTGSLTITGSDALVFGFANDLSSNNLAAGTGFTYDYSNNTGAPGNRVAQHKAVASSAAVTWTASNAGDNVMSAGIAFQIAGGGGVSAALTGQSATFAAGTVVPSTSVAQAGQSATFSTGTVTPSVAVALTGQPATFSSGTVGPAITVALTGQSATFTAGTLSPSGNPVVPLTGQAATSTAGTLTPSSSVPLTGQSATSTAGTLTASSSVSLSGQPATFSPGSMGPNITVALTGQQATFAAGFLTVPGDVTVSLTGSVALFTAGSLSVQGGGSLTNYLVKWTPFRLAQTLRCLQQGVLNVGNTFQNRAHLLTLAVACANGNAVVSPTLGWAKWRAGFGPVNNPSLGTSITTGAGLLLNVPAVPGFVASVGTNDSEV